MTTAVASVLGSELYVARALRAGPLRIGRAPGNELMLASPRVSSFHAAIALSEEGVVLTDLGSTNGTQVNGEAVRKTVVASGDVVRLGGEVDLLLTLRPSSVADVRWVLEDHDAGVLHPVSAGPITVGHDVWELTAQPDGVRVAGPEGAHRLGAGEAIDLGGRRFTLRGAQPIAATVRDESAVYPYRVRAGLGDTSSPFAVFERAGAEPHRIGSENRATLVYLLSRHCASHPSSDGWCDDETLRLGIWGREAFSQLANNLNVIIRRTRKELDGNGFDGRCIEKIHGYTRLRVEDVAIAS